jgi:hypothetical protein
MSIDNDNNSPSLLGWAHNKISHQAAILCPELSGIDNTSYSLSEVMLIASALNLYALSTTKSDLSSIEISVFYLNRAIDKVSNNIATISSHVNAVLYSFAIPKPIFASIVTKLII